VADAFADRPGEGVVAPIAGPCLLVRREVGRGDPGLAEVRPEKARSFATRLDRSALEGPVALGVTGETSVDALHQVPSSLEPRGGAVEPPVGQGP